MTIKQFQAQYFPNALVSEVTNRKQANGYFMSKTSCCWANGHVKGTGWTVLGQPSSEQKAEKRKVIVCKSSLIDGWNPEAEGKTA